MPEDIVRRYVERERVKWGKALAMHGYCDVDIDVSSDSSWKNGVRDLGKVAFWKVRGKDGIIIHHAKFNDPVTDSNYHGTGVYAVGESDAYFRTLGLQDDRVLKTVSFDGKPFEAVEYNNGTFEDLLKDKESTPNTSSQKRNPLSSMT